MEATMLPGRGMLMLSNRQMFKPTLLPELAKGKARTKETVTSPDCSMLMSSDPLMFQPTFVKQQWGWPCCRGGEGGLLSPELANSKPFLRAMTSPDRCVLTESMPSCKSTSPRPCLLMFPARTADAFPRGFGGRVDGREGLDRLQPSAGEREYHEESRRATGATAGRGRVRDPTVGCFSLKNTSLSLLRGTGPVQRRSLCLASGVDGPSPFFCLIH